MDLLIPLALAALLIFFLFNSRRKQKARAEQIKTGLVPGATVMTTFGVFGTVLSIDEESNQVTIESGPGTILRVHRQAIGQIDNPEADAAAVDAPVADSAETPDAEADAPAITDAELDAMNERKRAEGTLDDEDLESTDADEPKSADLDDLGSDDAAAEPKSETEMKADAKTDLDVTDSAVVDSDVTDSDVTDVESEDSGSTGTDTDKKN